MNRLLCSQILTELMETLFIEELQTYCICIYSRLDDKGYLTGLKRDIQTDSLLFFENKLLAEISAVIEAKHTF